jgi:dihydrolipoamide dehydrogenase
MCGILANQLKKQKMKIHTGTKLSVDSSAGADGPAFKFEQDGKEWRESFSQVLLSVGRTPNTGDLFAPDLDVRLDRKGFIEVDGNLGTGEASIFACGDVAGGALLAHKASHQAISIVDFITEGKPVSLGVIPAAVFTFPEFATVGKTEEEAREEGMEVKVGRFPYAGGSRSNAVDDKSGLVKIIADGDERVIGAHIVGGEAGELMPLLTHAVSHRMKASEFKELVCIHPTLSENIWEALGEISGFSIHI